MRGRDRPRFEKERAPPESADIGRNGRALDTILNADRNLAWGLRSPLSGDMPKNRVRFTKGAACLISIQNLPTNHDEAECLIWAACVVAIAAILGALYARVVPGLSSARTEPPVAETILATWLLHQSVPFGDKMSVNPAPDPSDVAAGKDLYREKCETCHAYDGGGKTPIGSSQFPRVPTLRSPAIAANLGRRAVLPHPQRYP